MALCGSALTERSRVEISAIQSATVVRQDMDQFATDRAQKVRLSVAHCVCVAVRCVMRL